MKVEELKDLLLNSDVAEFVDSAVLAAEAPHFSNEDVAYVARALSAKFGVEVRPTQIFVVGSAKLGYRLLKGKDSNKNPLQPFRPFRPESDIDIAVVSPAVFELIWETLSGYANRNALMPWDSGKLGDYMVYGWLRPDHFPKNVRLPRCDDWWDVFRSLSAETKFGRRAIRGALYHSLEQLRKYQIRSLTQCKSNLEAQI